MSKDNKETMTLTAIDNLRVKGDKIEDPTIYYWTFLALEQAIENGLVNIKQYEFAVVGSNSVVIDLKKKSGLYTSD